MSTPHGVGHTTYSNAVRTDFLSVRGASSAVPSDVDLQQYEGAIEKKKAQVSFNTNIIQLLLFSFNSGDDGNGCKVSHR